MVTLRDVCDEFPHLDAALANQIFDFVDQIASDAYEDGRYDGREDADNDSFDEVGELETEIAELSDTLVAVREAVDADWTITDAQLGEYIEKRLRGEV